MSDKSEYGFIPQKETLRYCGYFLFACFDAQPEMEVLLRKIVYPNYQAAPIKRRTEIFKMRLFHFPTYAGVSTFLTG